VHDIDVAVATSAGGVASFEVPSVVQLRRPARGPSFCEKAGAAKNNTPKHIADRSQRRLSDRSIALSIESGGNVHRQ
jgi:hypothetical protein